MRPSLTVGLYGMLRSIGRVVLAHGLDERRLIDRGVFGHLVGQLLDRVGRDLRHLPDAVLVALQMHDLLVEDLPRKLVRLLQYQPAVFGIGVVAEIGALVAEPLASGVDHDRERVGVLLEIVADRQIAEFGRVVVPPDRVAARPVAVRHRADIERHLDAAAGVEAGAAHLREVPARPEIARAHLGIGLEPAGRQHDRLARDRRRLALDIGDDAVHAVIIGHQPLAARLVGDVDAVLLQRVEQPLDETGTAAPRLQRQPAPEHELALMLEGLPRIHRREADALRAHPQQRLLALRDQQLGHVRVAAVVGQPAEIVVILVLRVGAEIRGRQLLLGQVAEFQQVIDAVIDKAQRACRIARVAAALVERRRFEHEHPRAALARRQRRAHPGIPRPDHDDIIFARDRHLRSLRPSAPASAAPVLPRAGRSGKRQDCMSCATALVVLAYYVQFRLHARTTPLGHLP